MAKEFTCDINPDFDFILEERGNSSINLRKVSWGNGPEKIDIRKWLYLEDNTERASKGVTLSDEGTNELTNVLVEQGYGDTKRTLKALMKRDDYKKSMDTIDDVDTVYDDGSEDYYDAKELLG